MKFNGAVLLLVLALVAGLCPAQTPAPLQTEAQGTSEEKDLPGYLALTADVGTGGQPSDAGIRSLASMGYKAVVNLRAPGEEGLDFAHERQLAEELGLKYYQVPVTGKDPKAEQVDQFLRLMTQLQGAKVYVHCRTGSRVGALMMCQRVLHDGVPLELAEKEARRIGLHSEPLRQFVLELIKKRQGQTASQAP